MRGAAEEDLALSFMQSQGLRLVARNVRFRGGELDLVMQDGDTLVIAEVRKRSRQDYGGAAASVGFSKQKRIVLATRLWLAGKPQYANHAIRFDVCALDGANKIEWLRAAFDAGGI
jgi:putative endonuclease